MKRWLSKLLFVAVVCAPAAVFAQSAGDAVIHRGQGWSLYSGQTVGNGASVVSGQLGWPGLSAQFNYGATDRFDLGGRLTLINYGFEGRVRDVVPGMKLQALARFQLLDRGRINLGVEFALGPLFYFRRYGTQVGLAVPLQFTAGVPIGSAMMANFGVVLPMFVIFGTGGGFYLPILFGGGLEYYIDRRLSASFNLKMGPSIFTRTGVADLAMDALVGVAYRF
ncbi:MAG: hypothetical protein IRZ16_05805 [Myxococcaceae bacterium]|nr:hypothetical protein [Myxococcaceae bacterium]